MTTPYYEKDGIVIYHGDCREILPTLESVDLVLTDPQRARLCWKIIRTGKSGKEEWRPIKEAEMYLARRKATDQDRIQNWIEYEE